MNVLVTGDKGFLGSHLMKVLGAEAAPPLKAFGSGGSADCDLSDTTDVARLFDSMPQSPDVIVHCAGRPRVGDVSSRAYRDNVMGTFHLLNQWPRGPGATLFLYLSSAVVYGPHDARDASPHGFSEGPDRARPLSYYAAAKSASEALAEAWASRQGENRHSCCLRPVAMVGPGMTHGLLPDLVYKFRQARKGLNNGAVQLIGKCPGSRKPYVHVRDVCRFILSLIKGGRGRWAVLPRCLNLSGLGEIDVAEAAGLAEDVLGFSPARIDWSEEGSWAGDQNYLRVDDRLARDIFGWSPTYRTSREAFHSAINQYVKDNHNERQ